MTNVTLKAGEGRTLRDGGCWIFDNEIGEVSGSYRNGDIVSVTDINQHFLGYGYLNDHSKIRVRILSRDESIKIDDEFWYSRLKDAYEYRKKVIDLAACRLVYAEADRLPGLIIDKYNEVLVIQADTLGIEVRKDKLVKMMLDILEKDSITIKGVYDRSDAKVRILEGLDRLKGFLSEPFKTNVLIEENGLKLEVDVANGQKTGYFLDQKLNRFAIRKICKDARVLDCFTHTGGFALNAAAGGAKEVIGLDSSELAINQARRNAELNQLENKVSFLVCDVFDQLPAYQKALEKFDVIILDPPAFTKTAATLKNAIKGYREINRQAMRLLNRNGFLVTCSCSEYFNESLFRKTILEAAKSEHKRLREVEFRMQAPDHPIVWGDNVSGYLKFAILEVVDR